MNLKRKDLIISIVALIVFIVIGIHVSALATNNPGITLPSNMWATTGNTTGNQIPTSTTTPTPSPTNSIGNNANTSNTTVPNTGLAEMPWLVIGISVVSAVFAYKKIKEYNLD